MSLTPIPSHAATSSTATPDIATLRALVQQTGQGHLLTFWESLDDQHKALLERALAAIDWSGLPALIETYVRSKPAANSQLQSGASQSLEPVPFFASDGSNWDRPRSEYARLGAELIARGKVAAFTVAGGQGTRLGFDGPKGCYPAGAVTGKPLFACLAEWIAAAEQRWCKGTGSCIPWYIMTSPLNHAATVRFFKENGYFGLRKHDVMFFQQGVMPSFDMHTGQVLLDQPHLPAVNPDGHGGSIRALASSGALADMRRRGVEQLSYTQIDNPLVRVIDPVFLGLHVYGPASSGRMSSKMCRKTDPGEKVGLLCMVDGRTAVVEYSDLPPGVASQRNDDGTLRFSAGNIAVHAMSVEFLEQLAGAGDGAGLPYHRAEKKVPYIDLLTGQRVEPAGNNAVKLELFVFDALPLASADGKGSIVLESDRVEEFAPIKNATGSDSPDSCRAIQTQRAARWLDLVGKGSLVPRKVSGGVSLPDCVIEVSPLHALEPDDLRGKPLRPIGPGEKVVL